MLLCIFMSRNAAHKLISVTLQYSVVAIPSSVLSLIGLLPTQFLVL